MKHQITRDPRTVQTLVAQRPALPLAVGLDLATSTGVAFAWFDPTKPVSVENLQPIHLSQWDLSVGNYESGALRFVRFLRFLRELNPSIVYFEDVKYSPPQGLNTRTIAQVMARTYPTAEFIGALKGLLAAYCEEQNVPCAAIPIGAIKKYATGRGNSNKVDMIKACNQQFGTDFDTEGYESSGVDNISDAAFCLLLGLEQYSQGVPGVCDG